MSDVAPPPPPPPEGGAPHGSGAQASTAPVRRSVPVGWVVLVIAGALVSAFALAPLFGGGALIWAHTTQRDADGYYSTPSERLETTSYAITSEEIDLGGDPTGNTTRVDLGDIATIRLDVRSVGEGATFVGIGPADEVAQYLRDVEHAEIEDMSFDPFDVDYRYVDGGAPPSLPDRQDFWVASSQGPGEQRLAWDPESGDWAVVIMNADGSAGVGVEAALAARSPWVWRIGVVLLAVGAVGLLVGATMLVIGVVGLARRSHIDLTGATEHRDERPILLEGRLDEPLSGWLWLVKWLLLIPHFIVLAVLWLAFTVVTVIAFFSILFTERYPRALFEFNLGVLRWTWRVTYYGYSALGTDRYPPFSLGAEPDYPATLTVAYPARLSRGLVLVKWWLLAIPHYLVLAVIGGTAMAGTDGGWWAGTAPFGLIGLLVLFAGVGLLFVRHYPRGLFDLVMGLNRWSYRVLVYVALMRDDYPPFRLDQGGSEPGPPPPVGPGSPPVGEAAAATSTSPAPGDAAAAEVTTTRGTAVTAGSGTNPGPGPGGVDEQVPEPTGGT